MNVVVSLPILGGSMLGPKAGNSTTDLTSAPQERFQDFTSGSMSQ